MSMDYPAGVTNGTIEEHFGSDDKMFDAELPAIECRACRGMGRIRISPADPTVRICEKCQGIGASASQEMRDVLDDGDEE